MRLSAFFNLKPSPSIHGRARLFYSIIIGTAAILGALSEEAQAQDGTSRSWLKLVHYRNFRVLPGGESDVDSPEFFLSPEGKQSPEKELQATLQAFAQPLQPNQDPNTHPQCKFPARRMWIQAHLPSTPIVPIQCPGYDAFAKNMATDGVSVVFSSYYLNNPASAFGHTFLRFHRKSFSLSGPLNDDKKVELLDVGVGYAATVTTSNSFLYALYGAVGLFRGNFTALPYYYKVREYAESENRDLWSYELNFSETELQLLVAHLWELGPNYLDYYYFSENCSFVLLTTLEAAKPELQLTEKLPYYVAPAHTIQVIGNEPGLVKDTRFRQSNYARFKNTWQTLSADDQRLLLNKVEHLEVPFDSQIPAERRRLLLDASIDFFDFKFAKALLREEPETVAQKQTLLMERASIPIVSPTAQSTLPAELDPARGHAPRKLSLAVGTQKDTSQFARFRFRPSLQDLLDPQVGYPSSSQIDFASVSWDFKQTSQGQSKLDLNEFHLFRVTSLQPIDAFNTSPSWQVALGAESWINPRCLNNQTCHVGFLRFSGGLAANPIQKISSATFFAMIKTELAASPSLQDAHFQLGIGTWVGTHWRVNSQWSILASSEYLRLWHHSFETRYSFHRNWAIGAAISQGKRPLESEFGVHWYF